MKTLKTHTRAVLLAVLVGMVGMLAFQASPANALPTLPPIITEQPSDPSTEAAPVFKFHADATDPNSADAVVLLCRRYVGAPPSPTAGWHNCYTRNTAGMDYSLDDANYQVQGVENGTVTFQVRASKSNAEFDGGPAASYTWTMNAADPTDPPVFTYTPEDPNTDDHRAQFEFSGAPGQEDNVNGFDCRIDNGAWEIGCGANTASTLDNGGGLGVSGLNNTLGNGQHTIDIRAKRGAGFTSPVTSYTWTNDLPNPMNPSVYLDDAAITKWNGLSGNLLGRAGSVYVKVIANAGDLNGDSRDDLLMTNTSTSSVKEVFVMYSSPSALGARSIGEFGPNLGYSIKIPGGQSPKGVAAIGDQNSDGVPDALVTYGTPLTLAVVYGVADASELPKCVAGVAQKRCLDLTTLSDDQGYKIQTTLFAGDPGAVGDFDGDGTPDFEVSDTAGNKVSIIQGGVRTGTVNLADLTTGGEVFTINGGSYTLAVDMPQPMGDMNLDGKDDFFIGSLLGSTGGVVFGRDLSSAPISLDTMTSSDGFKIAASSLARNAVIPIGDVNGDGRPDMATAEKSAANLPTGQVAVLYGPELPDAGPLLTGANLLPGTGYFFDDEGVSSQVGGWLDNLGDLNNDGQVDVLATAAGLQGYGFEGASAVGGAYVLFGQHDAPESPLPITGGLTPDTGVAVVNQVKKFGAPTSTSSNDMGRYGSVSLGDITDDGIPDFAITWPDADVDGGTNNGQIIIVSGGRVMASAKAGAVTNIKKASATLNASVTTTGRDSEVKFEYGTTDEYGSETPAIEVEGSPNGQAVSAELSGLEGETEYHYRTVTTNSLGLTYYGDDQTFSTNSDEGPSPCDADDTLPGCDNYDPCAADNTKPGCSGYCAANPNECNTTGPAKLTVITITKKMVVKRGKRGTAQVAVINTGGKAAKGVKVCVKAPKRLVKVKRCTKVGKLGSGASRTVKIKVKAKRKRGKAVLKHTAKGNNVSAKKAKTRVVIR